MAATVLLPEPIPPVNPILNMLSRSAGAYRARGLQSTRALRHAAALQMVEIAEVAATCDQLIEGPTLFNPPAAQDRDSISNSSRRQTMGNQDDGAVGRQCAHRTQ